MSIDPRLTAEFDVELGLTEVRDCADEHWTMRALCGASVGVEPARAARDARSLSYIVNLLMAGEDSAKAALANTLGKRGSDYQRCLWFNLAGRDPLGAAVDLARLVELLDARLLLAEARRAVAVEPVIARDPYLADLPDGPVGVFDPDFVIGPQWQAFADLD